jgi:hypothetical protein
MVAREVRTEPRVRKSSELDRPDVEAYVGMALRAMAKALQPCLIMFLPDDDRLVDGDPYNLLHCMLDELNLHSLEPMRHMPVRGATHRVLALRNRVAHPKLHDALTPAGALRGIDDMRLLVTAFGGPPDALDAIRGAVIASSNLAVPAVDPGDEPVSAEVEMMAGEDTPGFDEDEISARMTLRPHTEAAYAAAAVIRTQAFEMDGSIFGAGDIWNSETLERLEHRLLDQQERNLAEFIEHYVTQLSNAPRSVVQLASEVLYVHLWINAKSMTGAVKRDAVERILELQPDTTPMPASIAEALDMGLVRTGPWYHQQRWRYLHVIVDGGVALRRLSPSMRQAVLTDPWRFREWILEDKRAPAQRHALLHLLFPDTFEAIIAEQHKQRIVERLGDTPLSRTGNDDRDLFELRRRLASRYGPRFDYYRPPVSVLWQ